jgi:plasmid stability protein
VTVTKFGEADETAPSKPIDLVTVTFLGVILTPHTKDIMMFLRQNPPHAPVARMRTTLTLDDDLAAELDRTARRLGRSFKDVVNETIRRGLSTGERPAASDANAFEVRPEACGFLPGIDPLRLNQLLDQMEMDRFVAGQVTREGTP